MRCVINLATPSYHKGQHRLIESIRKFGNCDILTWTDESQIHAPKHQENPYAFKCYAFHQAIQRGYTSILWLDASVVAMRDITPIFEHIEKHGYIGQDAGHIVGTWTNDQTLDYFNLTRDEAMDIPMIGNAGLVGLDINSPKAMEFLFDWNHAMLLGYFMGQWNNDNKTESLDPRCKGHRHDMSCSSILWHQHQMDRVPGDKYLQYKSPNEPLEDGVYFHAQGL